MKKIFIDMTSVQHQGNVKVNGGGEYALSIFKGVVERIKVPNIFCGLKEKLVTPDSLLLYLKENKIRILYYSDNNQMEKYINEICFDVVFFPVCYPKYCYLHINDSSLLVTVLHDLSSIYADRLTNKEKYIGMTFKNLIEEKIKGSILRNQTQLRHIAQHKKLLSISKNQIVITDSEYSKYAMAYYMGIENTDRVIVQYPMNQNIDPDVDAYLKLKYKYKIEDNKFILLLSGSRWHKNNLFALEELDLMFSRKQLSREYKVLLTGVDDAHCDLYNKRIRNREQFIYLGYIQSGLLEALYKKMYALIYPSLYEGFGFPAIYAMKYGKIVISTTSTSLTEVCLDCAYYFDPTKNEALAVAILRAIYNPINKETIKKRYAEIVTRQERDMRNIIKIICEG